MYRVDCTISCNHVIINSRSITSYHAIYKQKHIPSLSQWANTPLHYSLREGLKLLRYDCFMKSINIRRVSFRNFAKGGNWEETKHLGGLCENCTILSYMSIHVWELLTCKGGIYIRRGGKRPPMPPPPKWNPDT